MFSLFHLIIVSFKFSLDFRSIIIFRFNYFNYLEALITPILSLRIILFRLHFHFSNYLEAITTILFLYIIQTKEDFLICIALTVDMRFHHLSSTSF
jgi:hypothetical protein